MPVYRFAPRGQSAPAAPPPNPHTFAHTIHPVVVSDSMHLQVSQQQLTIRQQLSTVYEGRLVGLDVEPSVGMQVVSSVDCMLPILTLSYVHTTNPTKGCGVITKVLRVRNDHSNRNKGGACRVEWDVGHGRTEEGGREGCSTGAKGQFALAAVALSLRDAAAADARDHELEIVAKRETLKVGKHAPPQIGVRVLLSYQPGQQRSLETGTICFVSNGWECARVTWDESGYSPTLYCTGFRGKFQLDLSSEHGAAIPLSRTPSDVLSELSTPVSRAALEYQNVIPDTIVGIHEPAAVGMRVRRRGHSSRGAGGTITQLAASGRLAYVRWDKADDNHLSGQAGGFEMFPTGYFGGHELAALTHRPLSSSSSGSGLRPASSGGGNLRRARPRGSVIVGRECAAQVGLRVLLLDPVQDLRDCSQAANAVIHTHKLAPGSVGMVVKVLHGTSRLCPDAFVEWITGSPGMAAAYPCGKDNIYSLKLVNAPHPDPVAWAFKPSDDWQHWHRLGLQPLLDPQTGQGNLCGEDALVLCKLARARMLEQASPASDAAAAARQHDAASGSRASGSRHSEPEAASGKEAGEGEQGSYGRIIRASCARTAASYADAIQTAGGTDEDSFAMSDAARGASREPSSASSQAASAASATSSCGTRISLAETAGVGEFVNAWQGAWAASSSAQVDASAQADAGWSLGHVEARPEGRVEDVASFYLERVVGRHVGVSESGSGLLLQDGTGMCRTASRTCMRRHDKRQRLPALVRDSSLLAAARTHVASPVSGSAQGSVAARHAHGSTSALGLVKDALHKLGLKDMASASPHSSSPHSRLPHLALH